MKELNFSELIGLQTNLELVKMKMKSDLRWYVDNTRISFSDSEKTEDAKVVQAKLDQAHKEIMICVKRLEITS